MKNLDFSEIPPLSQNKPKKLVMFLHGYGANGQDLINLSHQFNNIIPNAHFISPNAPHDLDNNFISGYQWFSLSDYDPKILNPQIINSNNILDNFISTQLVRFGLTRKDLIFIGFSQGSMMAMYNSLRNDQKSAGIISYSGKLILPSDLGETIKSKPEICLIHGTDDQVLPFGYFLEARKTLSQHQIPFNDYQLQGLGHGIDERGIKIGQEFLTKIKA